MGAVKTRSGFVGTEQILLRTIVYCVYLICMDMKITSQHGTYALVFQCHQPKAVTVGNLGDVLIASGFWIYVGSAFGPGGLRSRLRHHLKPSPSPHWHMDYIKTVMQPVEIWTTTDTVKREHEWARALASLRGASQPIAGFGATDCDCRAHLIHLCRQPQISGFRSKIRKMIPSQGRLSKWPC
jgi:Uri superfamily endonuclease